MTNYNSLSIEMCCTAGPLKVSTATENLAAELAADLLRKYGLGIDRLVRWIIGADSISNTRIFPRVKEA